jgi:hypothetical protein
MQPPQTRRAPLQLNGAAVELCLSSPLPRRGDKLSEAEFGEALALMQ